MPYYIYNDYDDEWFNISGLGIPEFKTKAEQQEFVKMVIKAYPFFIMIRPRKPLPSWEGMIGRHFDF